MTAIKNGNLYNAVDQKTDQTKQHQHQQKVDDVGKLQQTSSSTTSSPAYKRFLTTALDVIVFLTVSIGYIIQDWYYRIFGFPEKDLNGDIALITGGGGGLGRLLALKLCKLNVHIIIWDINQEAIDETVKQVRYIGGKCIGYKVDISNKEDVYRSADVLRRDVGNVTLLINNAGVASGRAFLDTPDHLIERSFNVNVLAHFWTTKAFLPAMLEHDYGHIVTIASLAGHVGISKLVDYCSSKFAAVGFDEALRLELENLGSLGVQTTCICPFFIQSTGMFDDVNSQWVPTLSSDDVANRIIIAIQKKEKIAVIPSYLFFMLCMKWVFPWGCISGFLRRVVPDAAPQNGLLNGMPEKSMNHNNNNNNNDKSSQNGYLLSRNNNSNKILNATNLPNNLNKVTPMLVQRMPSVGERVL